MVARENFVDVPLLQQREIEMKVLGPLIRAFAEKFGEDEVCRLVRCVMGDISYKLGREKAARVGRGLENLKKQCVAEWNKHGELEEEVIEDSDETLRFNVTRCAFAELYKELGYQDIGALISCDRDFSFIEGFDPDIELIRTGTIMNGDSLCDFCYRKKEARER